MRLLHRVAAGLALIAACVLPAPSAANTLDLRSFPAAPTLVGSELIPCTPAAGTETAYACTPAEIIALAAASFQPLTGNLTTLGAVSSSAIGRSILGAADAPTARGFLGLGTLATQSGTFPQTSVTGNAGTATKLAVGVTINGVTFDGSSSITVPAVDTATPRLSAANNLSDLNSAAAARTNLGLGSIATAASTDYLKSLPIPSGQYVPPRGFGGSTTTGVAQGANTLKLSLGYIRQNITITGLGVRVSTVSAGGNFQIGIYAMDPSSAWPTGPALVTSANISTATAAGANDTTVNYSIAAGWYWFAINCDNATAAAYSISTTGSASELVGSSSTTSAYAVNGETKASVTFGTWPTLTGNRTTDGLSDSVTAAMPLVYFKR